MQMYANVRTKAYIMMHKCEKMLLLLGTYLFCFVNEHSTIPNQIKP